MDIFRAFATGIIIVIFFLLLFFLLDKSFHKDFVARKSDSVTYTLSHMTTYTDSLSRILADHEKRLNKLEGK